MPVSGAADERFSPEVEAILRRAGWFDGRRFDVAAYESFALAPHAAARHVLAEFGGLRIGECGGPDRDFPTSDVDLRPEGTDRSYAGYPELDACVGSRLCLLGPVYRGDAYLLIDERGRVYRLMDTLELVADSFDEALEPLLLGRAF